MIIKRFSSTDNEENDEKRKSRKLNNTVALGSVAGGLALGSTIKSSRLTGKVVRYHNTANENVDSIMKNGLRASYSTDPNNLTNTALNDIPMSKKAGLVYTSKDRITANDVGIARHRWNGGFLTKPEKFREKYLAPKNSKTLKLVFDYDNDIKNQVRIENPELRGFKTAEEYYKGVGRRMSNNTFNRLGKGTHIFKGDIDASHIVGSGTYKKRTINDTLRYVRNNPGRFGKEALKVGATGALLGYGIHKIRQNRNRTNEETENSK